MDAKMYFKVSGINLVFLLAGVLIGPPIVSTSRLIFATAVHAQSKEIPDKASAKAEIPKPPPAPSCDEAHFECVAPNISTDSAAFGTVLAHRIASDQLMVNGFDPLKLHEATMNMLGAKGIFSVMDIQQIINGAKVAKPLRVQIK
jgi:hypothetical protein